MMSRGSKSFPRDPNKIREIKPKRFLTIITLIAFSLLFCVAIVFPSPVLFAIVVGVYLISTFLIFLVNTTVYYLNMLSFRKGFYLVFMILICLSLINQFIDISNWQLLLQLAAVGIFLDLALFQTPGISKIWNTEFDKGEYTLKTLSENNRLLRNNTAKALAFHKVIAVSIEDYRNIPELESWSIYKNFLLSYYSNYTENLNLNVHLIKVEWDEEANSYSSLEDSFNQMMDYHGILKTDEEWMMKSVNRLESGDEVLIETDLDDTIVLMPYFGSEYGFLLSVVGKGEVEANEVDAMYLLNMAYIIDWHIE
ncbi:type II toxin-antitoxin system SpoIISA family toxin [Planococcus rifietoensis]|uniref:type II toxin-antitoxin system SpoIISA family toxin n=1 Tax=Planococcus rifietoensis TaxID=200991 RepID=UPI00384AA330